MSLERPIGDTLLKLQDPTSAAAYYDAFLYLTCRPALTTIGSTVIVEYKGRVVLAEVDCMGPHPTISLTTLDVTLVETHQELLLHQKDILLCHYQNPQEDHLQIRTLLNITRCLILLTKASLSRVRARAMKYRTAAVRASTIALTLLHALPEESPHPIMEMEETARILRARANIVLGRSRFTHSRRDLTILLEGNPSHNEAKELIGLLYRKDRILRKADRKLAKEMCTWISKATDSTEEIPT